MGQRDAEVFGGLRSEVLARLIEVRGAIDHAYASIPEDRIGAQFDLVLDRMHSYLYTEEVEPYRSFAHRWMAMRVSDGFAPENLIHSAVAIGDVVVQVAQQRLAAGPERDRFVRAIQTMSFVAARLLVELLAEELDRRREQRRQLLGGRS